MPLNCDLLIVGSGFVGSIMGLIAARQGLSVVIVDQARHPRFAIGESTTPMANLLLEHLSARHGLPELLGFTEWGRWQKIYPGIPVGLKRGFTFLAHEEGRRCSAAREAQLLVAASPSDELADTHWFRAAFDQKLAELAVSRGARLFTGAQIFETAFGPPVNMRLRFEDSEKEVRAQFLFDASGPRGFTHRALGLAEEPLQWMPQASALFSHFTGVEPLGSGLFPGAPPYDPDAAAVHHLFPGGWIWALRFNNGIVSAGVSARQDRAGEWALDRGEPAWKALLRRFPTLQEQFARATAVEPFRWQRQASFRSARTVGAAWAMAPSAAAFVDPLLSTGFTLALLGVRRMAEIFSGEFPPGEKALAAYAAACAEDSQAAELLVASLFAKLGAFREFRDLSLLYFAASIYAEAQVRGGDERWLEGFQTRMEPFAGGVAGICKRSLSGALHGEALRCAVRELIQPRDLAGLCDESRRNWFPFV